VTAAVATGMPYGDADLNHRVEFVHIPRDQMGTVQWKVDIVFLPVVEVEVVGYNPQE